MTTTSRPLTALRTALTAVALAALAVPGALAAPAAAAPAAALPVATATPGGCGQLFDDFSYTSSQDPQLAARGWSVRSGGGGPGVAGGSWSPANVTFTGSGTARSMRLQAQTDGTPQGTVSAEVSHRQKFYEGTWAARVRFTDTPVQGADGDPVVQTFYGITPLAFPDDPAYGEADFEYLPNGGWGQRSATLFLTTWETYRPDPWRSDNISTPVVGGLSGWHDLVMTVDAGVVRYLVDGRLVAEHGGHVYPETPMLLAFNTWFIDLASHTGGVSRYEQDVDYVYHSADEVLTPAQVSQRVSGLRAAGVAHVDRVVPGTCTPTTPPTTPPTDPPATGTGRVRSGAVGMCLDVAWGGTANGTPVHLWGCNGTAAQRWTFGADGTLRAFGRCLDVTDWGTANGAKVQIWDCNPGQSNQTWVRHGDSYRNPASGKCLDNPDGRAVAGQRIQIWSCHGGSAQRWSLPGA